jgi:DNA gyrase inhibitor GyrI
MSSARFAAWTSSNLLLVVALGRAETEEVEDVDLEGGRSAGATLRHRNDDVGVPWTRTTGGPDPRLS